MKKLHISLAVGARLEQQLPQGPHGNGDYTAPVSGG